MQRGKKFTRVNIALFTASVNAHSIARTGPDNLSVQLSKPSVRWHETKLPDNHTRPVRASAR